LGLLITEFPQYAQNLQKSSTWGTNRRGPAPLQGQSRF
jgi:hypothetical protein